MQQDGPSVVTRPVFVDATGRRGRWIRRLFWALGLLVTAYIAVVFLALVGPPSLSRLAVPGAPGLRTATGGHGQPAAVLSPRPKESARATTGPGGRRPSGSPTLPTSGSTTQPAPTTAAPRSPTLAPTAAATARPTGPPATPRPRPSKTPPGQASSRPSPSPHSSHAHGATTQPSPTP